MNGKPTEQPQFDFRTGRPTSIWGATVSAGQRAVGIALNRQRARGIQEAARHTPPRESVSLDVWAAAFARKSLEWEVPLISLKNLGITLDRDGFIASEFLQPLKSGAEASPFQDLDAQVVYKLFPLSASGGVGKKVVLDDDEEGKPDLRPEDSILFETIEKLTMLHEAGAHPTEIVALNDTGDYLIAKQSLAFPMADTLEGCKAALGAHRDGALKAICAVTPRAPLRRSVSVVWLQETAWLVSDLHVGNVMLDKGGNPTIIDALVGAVTPAAIRRFGWLRQAIEDARALREGRIPPVRPEFGDGDDAEL